MIMIMPTNTQPPNPITDTFPPGACQRVRTADNHNRKINPT